MSTMSLEGMVNFASEQARLALEGFHIAEGERRIVWQIACIAHCRASGHDTKRAEHLLRDLEGNLGAWQAHRAEIQRIIELSDTQPCSILSAGWSLS